MRKHLRRLLLTAFAGALLALPAALGACRGQGGTFFVPPDAGPSAAKPCNNTTDCGGAGICVSGVCEVVKSCMNDMDCAADHKVCHSHRFYCVQCDGTHMNECPANEACQFDFTCVAIGGSDGGTPSDAGGGDGGTQACMGNCTDRTMCSNSQVCSNGHCCPPPARCFSPNDCPAAHPNCNGSTGVCFGGDNCMMDQDCEMKTGCMGGLCTCVMGVCQQRANMCMNDNDCRVNGAYVGKYCTLQSPPNRCAMAPSCTMNSDCAQQGLLCDTQMGSDSYHHCVNGTPCPMGNECNSTQACVNHVCVQKNCLNTPSLCTAMQHCDAATAMCVNTQMGMCSTDTDCQMGFYCNTLQSPAVCQLGCRDNTSCMGGICNANHQCQTGMGMVCGMCTTDHDCPAGTHCLMGLNLCYQPCDMTTGMGCTFRPTAMCVFGNCSCFL
jgi:hypothetical protein